MVNRTSKVGEHGSPTVFFLDRLRNTSIPITPSHKMVTKADRLTGLSGIQYGHRKLALHILDDRPAITGIAIGGALLDWVRGVMCHGVRRG